MSHQNNHCHEFVLWLSQSSNERIHYIRFTSESGIALVTAHTLRSIIR